MARVTKTDARVRFGLAAAVVIAAGTVFPGTAQAIIIAGGSGTTTPPANEEAPPTNPYWNNVGWRGFGTDGAAGASAVYLGNRYVLTAGHVGPGPVTFGTTDPAGGTTHNYDGSPVIRLQNPVPATGNADAVIFRLVTDPGLPTLAISSVGPSLVDNAIQMIGTGRERGSALTPVGTGLQGYLWAATRDKIWGVNEATDVSKPEMVDGVTSIAYRTRFDLQDGEAQLADKDSGSGAFVFDALENRWELSGMGIAIATFQGQQGDASAIGNQSLLLDASAYKSQIDAAVVPEPASAALLVLGAAALTARRRRTHGNRA